MTVYVEIVEAVPSDPELFKIGNLLKFKSDSDEYVVLVTAVKHHTKNFTGICLTPDHDDYMQIYDGYTMRAEGFTQFKGVVMLTGA